MDSSCSSSFNARVRASRSLLRACSSILVLVKRSTSARKNDGPCPCPGWPANLTSCSSKSLTLCSAAPLAALSSSMVREYFNSDSAAQSVSPCMCCCSKANTSSSRCLLDRRACEVLFSEPFIETLSGILSLESSV